MNKKYLFLALHLLIFLFFSASNIYAQLSDTSRERREEQLEERREALREERPKTAEEIIEWLKQRAEDIKKERRRKELFKFKFSAGVSSGHETNPATDKFQKGDQFFTEDFSTYWEPKFNNALSASIGYRLSKQNYLESEELSTFDHTIGWTFKWMPFKSGKLQFDPGIEYDWLIYPFDVSSSTETVRGFFNWKHYTAKKWNIGGRYEYYSKTYDKKAARDTNELNLNFPRNDMRNTVEFWWKYYWGKYTITLKDKFFRNNSNDQFQQFNDYDSNRGYITIARSLLKDGKLYVSYSSNYETKAYYERLADERISRHDQIIEHKMNMYYTLVKHWTLDYAVTYKKSGSNDATGVFKNLTNKVGLTLDF